MEFIRFIFSSFWIFCGMIILVSTVGAFLIGVIGTIRGCDVKISVFGNVNKDNSESLDEEDEEMEE
jgi:hypothetical protein